jgi:hypothetical protein
MAGDVGFELIKCLLDVSGRVDALLGDSEELRPGEAAGFFVMAAVQDLQRPVADNSEGADRVHMTAAFQTVNGVGLRTQ